MTGSLHHTVNYTCLYITLKVLKISLQSLLSLNNVGWLVGFVALRPKSTAMVIAGRSVHLTTLFPGQA